MTAEATVATHAPRGRRPAPRSRLDLFVGIGTLVGLAGGAILVWLLVEKLLGESIGTRPALTAGVLLVIVGVQLISLGLVAELIVKFAADRGSGRVRSRSDARDRPE